MNIRISALLALAVVTSATVSRPLATALSPITLPSAGAPATYPGSTRMVESWKLLGHPHASATQIAPRWVLSADHSSMPVGSTFSNGYGAATVAAVFRPDVGYDEDPENGIDLTLHLLSTAIAAPSYPALLSEPVSAALDDSLPGFVLNVGFGGTEGTGPSIGWSTPAGGPVNGVTPNPVGGDSGGAAFWFATESAQPVLAAIITRLGSTALSQQQAVSGTHAPTGEDVRAFMEEAFAAHLDAQAPAFVSLSSVTGSLDALRPAAVDSVHVAARGATTATIRWSNPMASPVPRSGARIIVNGVQAAVVSASASEVKLTGLKWFSKQTVRVVSVNANGDALPHPQQADTVTFTTRLF